MTHPDFETLIEFAAGELMGRSLLSLNAHLAACEQCRSEAERLLASVAPPPGEMGSECALQPVLEDARRWEIERASADPDSRSMKTHASGAIADYVGARAADRIVEKVSPYSDDLLSRVESVLALFLGCKAAAELTGHVVDGIIVRP